MKIKLALLAAAGTVALISGASAQEDSGYYGALGAGVVIDSDVNDLESSDSAPAAFDSEYNLDTGVSIYGALGKYFDRGMRGEIELAHRTQEINSLPGDSAGFAGFESSDTLGDVAVSTLMVNLIKDFDLDTAGRLNPYIGAGVGAALVRPEFDNLATAAATTVADMATSNNIVVGDKEYVAAFQGLAGLTFDFTENMHIDLRYKYLQTGEYDYGGYVNGPFANLSSEYSAHEITAGLRWDFGAVAPAPVPVAEYKTCFDGSRVLVTADCPVEIEAADEVVAIDPLIVYFDFAKSNLTGAAETLIAARAEEALEGDVSSITVAGNTDSVGSAASNQALSARRAAVVRDALIANGIDGDVISVEAYGETRPAKETPDGTREPLNRRTEVEFNF